MLKLDTKVINYPNVSATHKKFSEAKLFLCASLFIVIPGFEIKIEYSLHVCPGIIFSHIRT
jgi:hypothetical protein